MIFKSIRTSINCLTTRKCSTKFSELLNDLQPRESVFIQGWVYRAQTYGKKLFLKLTDGQSPHRIQAIVPREICKGIWVGSAIRMRGKWQSSRGAEQAMEFLAEECTFVNPPAAETPLVGDNDVWRHLPHLRPKMDAFGAVFRLRSRLTHLTHNFFSTSSFHHVDIPLISQNDCEGAGEVFTIASKSDPEFFGEIKPILQVSGQLHLEAVANAIPRVYSLLPVFRADKSGGRFNMAEFRMLEAECAFMDSLQELCSMVETFLKFVIKRTREELGDEMQASSSVCERSSSKPSAAILSDCLPDGLEQQPFPRITFHEAIQMLGRPEDDYRLKPLHRTEELALVDEFRGPLFVTHFPAQQKPFYMRRTEGDEQLTESFDLLAPIVGELAGGSVREWDPDKLAARLPAGSKLDWYLELRRKGYARSAGFGMGMDRMMQSLFGIANIRDTIPFPRSHTQLRC